MATTTTTLSKPKSELTEEELAKKEEEEFNTGPLSVLTQSVKNNTQVNNTEIRNHPQGFSQNCPIRGLTIFGGEVEQYKLDRENMNPNHE